MKKRKIIAVYVGDFRLLGEPMGKFFFDYDATTTTFILRGDEGKSVGDRLSYSLRTVIEDSDFILLELKESNTGNHLDDDMSQLDKLKFFLEELEGL